LPFTSLRFDPSKVPPIAATDPSAALPLLDAAYKSYGSIIFVHGESGNPFTEHTDTISNNGTVVKDVSVATDITALTTYYNGAVGATITGLDITTRSQVITSPAILTKLLQLVIEYNVDTAANVQKYFGNYVYAPTSAADALKAETKLPVVKALSDPLSDSMFKAYIAYFGRPADPAGLQFWVDKINQSGSAVTDMVNNFGNSIEYKNLYSQSSSQTIVNSLYQHLFNRDAEPAGLKFWADFLDKGTYTLSNIAFTIVNSAQNSDSTIVSEKVSAARSFTAALDTQREVDLYSNDTSALNARKWLSTVTADHTANVKIVGIAQDVINGLQTGVDGVLAANGLHAGFY
ncbi:MAG TPA: DUF4214 domain-containing protein, partial [Noviherbaspirillum sp.]